MAKSKKTDSTFIKGIEDTRKSVTILFTDIENSTKMWETRGDIKGRVLVNRHNQILFPIIKKYRGKVIKTIGDSIMASFKEPGNAVKASIAMQQMIDQERQNDKTFKLKIRIGLHTGKALVEKDDVFGDVVNVAARVEAESLGSQILVSGSTASKLRNKEFNLEKYGSFNPKGKKGKVNLFECDWEEQESLIGEINTSHMVSIFQQQKLELILYMLVSFITLAFIYQVHIKYLLADSETAALWLLNPAELPQENPWLFGGLAFVILLPSVFLFRMKVVPVYWMNTLKGINAFGISLIVFYYLFRAVNFVPAEYWSDAVRESNHLFVEVLINDARLYEAPNTDSKQIERASSGDLLLLNDIRKSADRTWNRVLLKNSNYGWIERVSPPRIGVPEQRVTYTSKYYLRLYDLYNFLFSCLAFVWGYRKFKIRPI